MAESASPSSVSSVGARHGARSKLPQDPASGRSAGRTGSHGVIPHAMLANSTTATLERDRLKNVNSTTSLPRVKKRLNFEPTNLFVQFASASALKRLADAEWSWSKAAAERRPHKIKRMLRTVPQGSGAQPMCSRPNSLRPMRCAATFREKAP